MSLLVRRTFLPSIASVVSKRGQHDAKVKPFESIPGPRPLPFIGNMWKYRLGIYSFDEINKTYAWMYKKFGPLVKEVMLPGRTIVHVFDPDDMLTVYQNEGPMPERQSHGAVARYRKERPSLYLSPGLVPSNGPEWLAFREVFQNIVFSHATATIAPSLEDVVEDFVARIAVELDRKKEIDIRSIVFQWALESIGVVILNQRLGCLSAEGNEDSLRLIKAANDIHEAVFFTENNIKYKKYYKLLVQAEEVFESIVLKYIKQAKDEIEKGFNLESLLSKMLTSKTQELSVFTMLLDMFLGGIDTTANALTYVLYNVANNPSAQETLRAELMKNLPTKTTRVTLEDNRLPYLQHVLNESLRISQVSVGAGRVLPKDLVLSGYRVPAKTMVILQHQVACKQEKYFFDPLTFNPDRFEKENRMKMHGMAFNPFGTGPRSCLGKKIASVELRLVVARVFRSFNVSYHYKPLKTINRLVNVPAGPVRLRFEALEN